MIIRDKEEWLRHWNQSCLMGNLENLAELSKPKWAAFMDLNENEGFAFHAACLRGKLEVIQFLINMEGFQKINARGRSQCGLVWACEGGHLDVIKYLLTSPDLNGEDGKFDVQHNKNEAIIAACSNGQWKVLRYLLTSKELIESGHTWANIHDQEDKGFFLACKNEEWEVIRWLVMEYEIEKTSFIENIIETHPQAQEYFRARQELWDLKKCMESNEIKNTLSPAWTFSQEFKDKEKKEGVKKAKKL